MTGPGGRWVAPVVQIALALWQGGTHDMWHAWESARDAERNGAIQGTGAHAAESPGSSAQRQCDTRRDPPGREQR